MITTGIGKREKAIDEEVISRKSMTEAFGQEQKKYKNINKNK